MESARGGRESFSCETRLPRDTCSANEKDSRPLFALADQPGDASSEVQADLGELRRFPGACLATNHDDLMIANRAGNLFASSQNWQIEIKVAGWSCCFAPVAQLQGPSEVVL